MVLQDTDFWNTLSPKGSVKICIADTGYDINHEDLPKQPNVTGSNNDEYPGEDWRFDGHGHGTHCAGTIAAIGSNDKGVVGIIPDNKYGNFRLVIAKADGDGDTDGIMETVETCKQNGANIISLSLGCYDCPTEIEKDYYNKLYAEDGIPLIAAAGNIGTFSKMYPASYPSLMSVAAIDAYKDRASFSQYNNQVEISAPGVSVLSTLPFNSYASWSGTSMATPHVAAVAGLLWMQFPNCTNYQIRNVLNKTAKDLEDDFPGCDKYTGYGLVQAKDAYDLLSQGNCGGEIGKEIPEGMILCII